MVAEVELPEKVLHWLLDLDDLCRRRCVVVIDGWIVL